MDDISPAVLHIIFPLASEQTHRVRECSLWGATVASKFLNSCFTARNLLIITIVDSFSYRLIVQSYARDPLFNLDSTRELKIFYTKPLYRQLLLRVVSRRMVGLDG